MRPSFLTRWIVAALLTVSVPLCCCQAQPLLSLLWGGGAVHAVTEGEGGHSANSLGHTGHGSHDGEAVSSVSEGHCQDGSCQNGSCDDVPCGDDGDCSCGNTNLLAASPTESGPAGVLASSSLFSMLAEVAPLYVTQRSAHSSRLDAAPIPRPPTSLLRLHCALLV